MPERRHWVAFADDAGDPGPAGSSHFLYAVVVVDGPGLVRLHEARARFRVAQGVFGEHKPRRDRRSLVTAMGALTPLCDDGSMLVAVSAILKANYAGPWLRDAEGLPRDGTFLRNYLTRHSLELAFSGHAFGGSDYLDIVLDRTIESDAKLVNARRYFNSEFTEGGKFGFPKVRHVTQADSRYVEGLQVADHFASVATAVVTGKGLPTGLEGAARAMRLETVISGRPFQIHDEAQGLLSEQ